MPPLAAPGRGALGLRRRPPSSRDSARRRPALQHQQQPSLNIHRRHAAPRLLVRIFVICFCPPPLPASTPTAACRSGQCVCVRLLHHHLLSPSPSSSSSRLSHRLILPSYRLPSPTLFLFQLCPDFDRGSTSRRTPGLAHCTPHDLISPRGRSGAFGARRGCMSNPTLESSRCRHNGMYTLCRVCTTLSLPRAILAPPPDIDKC